MKKALYCLALTLSLIFTPSAFASGLSQHIFKLKLAEMQKKQSQDKLASHFLRLKPGRFDDGGGNDGGDGGNGDGDKGDKGDKGEDGNPPDTSLVSGTYNQRINHADANDKRRFKQRFYYSSSYASGPEAPVVFYICGEATCEASELGSAVGDYASGLKAHRISLEHRYYGKSQPFPTLSADNLKYLTTENALEDLRSFQNWAKKKYNLKGPWIVIGGSYPGSLAAYFRTKYPNLAVGALASSGPVEARENFEAYDEVVTRTVGPACAAKMRDAVAKIEAAIGTPEWAKIKEMFNASEVSDEDPADFLYIVADMGAIAVQYGFHEGFCSAMESSDNPVETYGREGSQLFAMFGLTAKMDSPDGAKSEDPNDYLSPWGIRQWMYQSCTEYGYWQTANADPTKSVRSKLLDMNYQHKLCARIFGIPLVAQPQKLNDVFYDKIRAADSTVSNILFYNGSNDPWNQLSLTTERSNNSNPNVALMTIAGGSHCTDLYPPSPFESQDVQNARKLARESFAKWTNSSTTEAPSQEAPVAPQPKPENDGGASTTVGGAPADNN